ncbi:MAG TPA: DUF4279 domain-containing protein [Rhodobacterales bacterium]|nr:DUF4279 domain-containing protein [Rhodobacterales bacterium]
MAIVAESAAMLALTDNGLAPDQVSAVLGSAPDQAARMGDKITLPGGGQRMAETGYWHRSAATCQPGDPDAQISALFAPLTTDTRIWASLAETLRIEVHLRLFLDTPDEATRLKPETLRLLADRHAALVIEIIAPYTPSNSCAG